MIVSDASLAALLLTNRLVDVGAKPLSAGEYWALVAKVPDLDVLLGADEAAVAQLLGDDKMEAGRIIALLDATTAFAYERERLEEEGIRVLSTFDPAFPARLIERLGTTCPASLTVAGPVEWLSAGGLGVVGSRDASPEALEVARSAAQIAVDAGVPVISGLARGVDQESMAGALDGGGAVVGIPAEGLRVVARNPEVRRPGSQRRVVHRQPLRTGDAVHRRQCDGAQQDRLRPCRCHARRVLRQRIRRHVGGREGSDRRGFGPVAVWSGDGAGPGNAALVALGGTSVTDIHKVFEVAGDHRSRRCRHRCSDRGAGRWTEEIQVAVIEP